MIKANNLTIWKEGTLVIEGLSFVVEKNQCLSILGPNHAGKSAVLATIAEPLAQYTGEVSVNHFVKDSASIDYRHRLGYLPANFTLDSQLSGIEYLEIIGSFYNLAGDAIADRSAILSKIFNCQKELYQPASHISASDLHKIGLMASFIHNPNVLVLDEPALHLDLPTLDALEHLLEDFLSKGGSLLIAESNPIISKRLADKVIIIDNEKIHYDGTKSKLLRDHDKKLSPYIQALS